MGKTDFTEALFLDHLFGTTPTEPLLWDSGLGAVRPIYVGLFINTLPAEDGTGGEEVAGGSYARVIVVQDGITNTFGDAVAGLKTTVEDMVFPTATADWGTIIGAGFWDHATAGNMLYSQALAATRPVNNGDTARYNSGSIAVTDD